MEAFATYYFAHPIAVLILAALSVVMGALLMGTVGFVSAVAVSLIPDKYEEISLPSLAGAAILGLCILAISVGVSVPDENARIGWMGFGIFIWAVGVFVRFVHVRLLMLKEKHTALTTKAFQYGSRIAWPLVALIGFPLLGAVVNISVYPLALISGCVMITSGVLIQTGWK